MLYDLSDYGHVRLAGKDARQFLHNLCTNDILKLHDGDGCEAYFCDPRGKTLFHVLVLCDGDSFLLTTEPGYAELLLKHLDKYLISEEATLEIEPLMMMHTTLESETLAEFHFLHREATIIRRVDRLGKPGFDLLSSKKQAEATHSREEFETMRLEAGTPIFGKDIDENRFVMEVANAARAVSYSKGCFPGQEPVVMSRDRAGGVSRFFVGLKVDGPVVPAGGKLVKDNQEVGIVTSCGYSPKLGGTLALGYVRKPHHERGTILDLHGLKAEVLGYPPCPG